jgi:hypothetical protein
MKTRRILVGCGCSYVAAIGAPAIYGIRPAGSGYAAAHAAEDVPDLSCRALNISARYAFGAPRSEPVHVRAEAS